MALSSDMILCCHGQGQLAPVFVQENLPIIDLQWGNEGPIEFPSWRYLPGLENSTGFRCNGQALELTRATGDGVPLYYTIDEGGRCWCSTRLVLLRQAGVALEEDRGVWPELFAYRCISPPATFFKNVRQVPFGGCVNVEYRGGRFKITDLGGYRPESARKRCRVDDAADLLDQNVRNALLSRFGDSRAGLLFSGGIDSSVVYRSAPDLFSPIWSSSYPFDADEQDRERIYAEAGAADMELVHQHVKLPSVRDYLAHVVRAIDKAEQPIHHLQSALLDHVFLNMAELPVSLAAVGLGCGGCFGNFRNHLYWRDKKWVKLIQSIGASPLLQSFASRCGRGSDLAAALACHGSWSSSNHPLWQWHLYGDPAWVQDTFGVTFDMVIQRQRDLMNAYADCAENDLWAMYSLMIDEASTYSIWTQIARGNGIDLYSPFYDSSVLEAACSLDWHIRLHAPKNALRKAMASRLGVPDSILNRAKSGFGPTSRAWRAYRGIFQPLLQVALKGVDFDPDLLEDRDDLAAAFIRWSLLNLGIWRRLFILGDSCESLIAELDTHINAKVPKL